MRTNAMVQYFECSLFQENIDMLILTAQIALMYMNLYALKYEYTNICTFTVQGMDIQTDYFV